MKILSIIELHDLGWEFTNDLPVIFAYKKVNGKTVNGAKANTMLSVRLKCTYIENELKLKTV